MAKVQITGVREVSFPDERTGRMIEGLSLYYIENLKPGADGLKAQGYHTQKQWIPKTSPLYNQLIAVNFSDLRDADFSYDVIPPRKNPQLVDVIIHTDSE